MPFSEPVINRKQRNRVLFRAAIYAKALAIVFEPQASEQLGWKIGTRLDVQEGTAEDKFKFRVSESPDQSPHSGFGIFARAGAHGAEIRITTTHFKYHEAKSAKILMRDVSADIEADCSIIFDFRGFFNYSEAANV